jgi:hypothetical protein
MIPLSITLQLATWRPVDFLGQNSTRIGSIRRQSSSGISQIVPRGLRRGFGRAMAAAPMARPEEERPRYNLLSAKGIPAVLG